MKHQITASMAKDIAFKLGAELNDEEAEVFADGYNVAMLQGKTSVVEPEEVLICDLCGHDAWHQGDRTYECTEGHVFEVRAPKNGGEVTSG
ncbi:hypothetical protein M8W81_004969 [Salmonella enterica]|nr:hypothetical protein [Salmonella enterica]EJF6007602.1 hypothetical protein [Salmonella enterica]EJF6164986.1 hypothetical protein [Salmonella enterica]